MFGKRFQGRDAINGRDEGKKKITIRVLGDRIWIKREREDSWERKKVQGVGGLVG